MSGGSARLEVDRVAGRGALGARWVEMGRDLVVEAVHEMAVPIHRHELRYLGTGD